MVEWAFCACYSSETLYICVLGTIKHNSTIKHLLYTNLQFHSPAAVSTFSYISRFGNFCDDKI